MRKSNVLVYHASFEKFTEFCNYELFKFKGKTEVYGIYYELVVSTDDVKFKLYEIMNMIELDDESFEKKLFSLKDNLCRLIYNSKQECLFILTENLSKWKSIALRCELKEWNLLNGILLENIIKKRIEDISSINISVKTQMSHASISFQGNNIESNENFQEYLKYATSVNSIKKNFGKYEIELLSGNHAVVIDEDNSGNVRKLLSKVIGIGE